MLRIEPGAEGCEVQSATSVLNVTQDLKRLCVQLSGSQSPPTFRKKNSIFRMDSCGDREEISPSHPGEAVEYFFASDASAIIEHTNRVIFLEDDDVASVAKGQCLNKALIAVLCLPTYCML